jgi:hypothetical protein
MEEQKEGELAPSHKLSPFTVQAARFPSLPPSLPPSSTCVMVTITVSVSGQTQKLVLPAPPHPASPTTAVAGAW